MIEARKTIRILPILVGRIKDNLDEEEEEEDEEESEEESEEDESE